MEHKEISYILIYNPLQAFDNVHNKTILIH